jgi:Domain of unknown function (DUF4145)
MLIDTTATNLAGTAEAIRLQQTPDLCPICHRNVHPKLISSILLPERSLVQTVFRCTHQKCQELFIATYLSTMRSPSGRLEYKIIKVAPKTPHKATFPDTITTISPTFIEIYNQSLEAEGQQLDQLFGVGLRKALEFLVKDYAISEHPDKEVQIKQTLLAKCISDFVVDSNVKECAKRAAWLGNDETHYTRKWEEKDVSDLKLLVRLTVNWIDNAVMTKKYISDMGTGKTS